jgi:hypothetical protein
LELTCSSFGSESSDFSDSSPFIQTATSQRASFALAIWSSLNKIRFIGSM